MKKGTYVYTLLLALDRFAAAVLFNRADITISSLCWCVAAAGGTTPSGVALRALGILKLNAVQASFLKLVARGLEFISTGHCCGARETDLCTAADTAALLNPPPAP